MDKLIRFITDATGCVVALLAAIGFIASICGMCVIFHMESKDMWEDEDGKS